MLMASSMGKAYEVALESAVLRVVSAMSCMMTPLMCRAIPIATPLPRAYSVQVYT